MSISLTLQKSQSELFTPKRALLSKWIQTVASRLTVNGSVTIRIVDETESQMLNEQYRKKSGPTNVLSFPSQIPEIFTQKKRSLGDIVICALVLEREATTQKKTLEAHWAHIVIHGMLHLLGYDHMTDAEASVMEGLEIDILKTLGYKNPYENTTKTMA